MRRTGNPPQFLSEREQQILSLMARGHSNKQIGETIGLSDRTIEKYLGTSDIDRSIYLKLGVANRKQAVNWVWRYRPDLVDVRVLNSAASLDEQVRLVIKPLLLKQAATSTNLARKLRIPPIEMDAFLLGRVDLPELNSHVSARLLSFFNVAVERQQLEDLDELARAANNFATRSGIGAKVLSEGIEVARQSWGRAIPYFRTAEQLFGSGNSYAAYAALEGVRMLIYLGDLHQATTEISRIDSNYQNVMVYDANAKSALLSGWLGYQQGDYVAAENEFRRYLAIAAESGTNLLGNDTGGAGAIHFLGRILSDKAVLADNRKESEQLRENAYALYEESYQTSLQLSSDLEVGFELLRMAELQRAMDAPWEARSLRRKAADYLGNSPEALHLDLEEARVHLADFELEKAEQKARSVLEARTEMKYAKGVAEALRTIGDALAMRGKPWQALEHYAVALCSYPFHGSLGQRLAWRRIEGTIVDFMNRRQLPDYHQFIETLREMIGERREAAAVLTASTATGDEHIEAILQRLTTMPIPCS